MSEFKWSKVRTGGLFSGVKVMFEYKFLRPVPNGEAQSITMYHDKQGRVLGMLEYEIRSSECKIMVFSIQDWSSPKFAEKLIKEVITISKKHKCSVCKIEIYDTDNKTHDKLTVFKGLGFGIESGGNVTGYNQYHLVKKL